MIGIGSAGSATQLEEQLGHVGELERPFGIGLVDVSMARDPLLLPTALAAQPTLVSVSFADNWDWVSQVHDAGIIAATQVADLRGAQRAVAAGVDVLVARGAEGGGHGEPLIGTLPLLTAVLDHMSVPVLAAGGISSGRGLAAVLAAGAAGAWLGTVFAACTESLASDETRRALLAAQDTDTVLTRVFDIAAGYQWPPNVPERVLRNDFSEKWTGHEDGVLAAVATEDHRLAPVNAGQGVAALTAIRPAGETVTQLCTNAAELLGRWGAQP